MVSGKSEEKAEIRKIRTERRCYIKSHVPAYFSDGEHDFFTLIVTVQYLHSHVSKIHKAKSAGPEA